jgi:hypothetical protein
MQGDSRKIEKNLAPIMSAMRVLGQMKRLACEAAACGDVVRVRGIALSRSPQRDLFLVIIPQQSLWGIAGKTYKSAPDC